MDEHYVVVDCDRGQARTFRERYVAFRWAAALHAARGTIVEVVGAETGQQFLVPPDARRARSS
jgi:hypothetical protein